MPRTRAFRSGNSQAIRIPRELAYGDGEIDLEINRRGDVITIHPVYQSRKETADAIRRLPRPSRVEKRVPIRLPDRKGN